MDVKDVEISISFDKKYMDVQVETESAGRLIGRHGKNLRALEELAQVVARDEAETFLIVRLNIGDYLERREETLRYLANDFADRAIETDRLVKLDPMSLTNEKSFTMNWRPELTLKRHLSEKSLPLRYDTSSIIESCPRKACFAGILKWNYRKIRKRKCN